MRALIAIMIVFVTLWVAMSNKVSIAENMPKWLLAIVGAVIGFYFGNRGLKITNREDTAIDRIYRFKALGENGTIIDEEFTEKKKDLLARI
ncbi:MAG: hypothetical protein JXQ30_13130 [Spirochaetes bacterium]|nr:hypothetical protein [Spirochaetota bacterium]